jgi:choice-of-anchor C domain-containing protein
MKNLFILAAVTLILIGASARPTTSQILNGSFEDGQQDPGMFWIILHSPSNLMDNWLVSFGAVDYIGGWWQASDGVRSVDMNGPDTGEISQTVATVPGLTYAVAFDMSGNADGPPIVKLMTVTADGGQAQTYSYDTALAGNTRADMRWETKRYSFTAVDESTVLTFRSDVGGLFGPTLDNVEFLEGICHRNNGKKGQKTLMVSPSAIPAHMAHGDSIGPCADDN